MLGTLRIWFPLYMAGQITPYYLKQPQGDVFLHCLRVSDTAVMCGEAIRSHEDEGMMIFTRDAASLAYYKKRAERIRSHAIPLVQTFRKDEARIFRVFYRESTRIPANWHVIMNVPPLYTIPEALLQKMIARHGFTHQERRQIMDYHKAYCNTIEDILLNSKLKLEVPAAYIDKEGLPRQKLCLAGLFIGDTPEYTEEEYREHVAATQAFAEIHNNMILHLFAEPQLFNSQISVCEGKFVIISKGNNPVIQLVADHPRLLHALEHFVVPHTR